MGKTSGFSDIVVPAELILLKKLSDHFGNILIMGGSKYGIHFRKRLSDLVWVSLGQASGYDDILQFLPFSFQPGHIKDRIDSFFLRTLDKTTCVNDRRFRLGKIIDHLIAVLFQDRGHTFCIDEILRAA